MSIIYHAKHILISEEEDIEYIMEKLNAGEKFEDLAKEFSECDSAIKGGDLGKFSSGTMLPEFERELYHMKPNEVRAGLKTKFGFHIILKLE